MNMNEIHDTHLTQKQTVDSKTFYYPKKYQNEVCHLKTILGDVQGQATMVPLRCKYKMS